MPGPPRTSEGLQGRTLECLPAFEPLGTPCWACGCGLSLPVLGGRPPQPWDTQNRLAPECALNWKSVPLSLRGFVGRRPVSRCARVLLRARGVVLRPGCRGRPSADGWALRSPEENPRTLGSGGPSVSRGEIVLLRCLHLFLRLAGPWGCPGSAPPPAQLLRCLRLCPVRSSAQGERTASHHILSQKSSLTVLLRKVVHPVDIARRGLGLAQDSASHKSSLGPPCRRTPEPPPPE